MPAVYDDQKPKTEDIRGGITPEEEAEMEQRAIKGAEEDRHKQLAKEKEEIKISSKVDSIDVLGNKEASVAGTEDDNGQADSEFGYHDEGKSHKLTSKLKKKRNKYAIGLVGGGLLGMAAIIAVIVSIIGTLLIPQLAQHIAEYEFARVTRQFAESAEEVTDEKMAMDGLTNSAYTSLRDKLDVTPGSLTDKLIATMDKFSTANAIKKLEVNNGFNLTYATDNSGRSVLKSMTLDGVEYSIKEQSLLTKYIPYIGTIIDFKNGVSFAKDAAPALRQALRLNDAGALIRSSAVKDIREELGINLAAFKIGEFLGKDPAQARLGEEKAKVNAIDQSVAPDNAVTQDIKSGDAAAEEAETKAVSSPAQLEDAIQNGGFIQNIITSIENAIKGSSLKSVISAINPAYAVAMPVCIIYDGSLDNSGGTIDNQTRQQQAAYYYIESVADQQKDGSTSAEAIGAINDDVDPQDISQSIPEERAAGQVVDTSDEESAEASAGGQYTLLSSTLGEAGFPGASAIAAAIDAVANNVCPILTNLWASAALGIGNIAIGILTFGSSDAEEASAEGAAKVVTDEVESSLVSRFISRAVIVTSRVGKLLSDSWKGAAKSAVEISGLTMMAKLIVLDRAMQTDSGFAQGINLANEADSGGNIQAGMISQQVNYGRPMTSTEVSENNQIDQQDISYQNSQKSMYQRYLAFSNADSLASKIGMTIYADANSSFFTKMFADLGKIIMPLNLISKIFGSFDNHVAMADAAANATDYGNVQFGWSTAEEALITSDPSYQPVENQQVLDSASPINGQSAEDYISSTYGQCFTDSIGTLLSSGLIQRDDNGDIIANQGTCSPDNLGPGNLNGLVFRWRLSMSYNNALTLLTQEANVSSGT